MINTDYGKVFIGSCEEVYKELMKAFDLAYACKENIFDKVAIGLSGGATIKGFYKWAVDNQAFSSKLLKELFWYASDERAVPLESDESNFGNADRLFLTPLGVDPKNKMPWDMERGIGGAVEAYNRIFYYHCFHLCILGLGEDCHIASLFPKSYLLKDLYHQHSNFSYVEMPNGPGRFTVTPHGILWSRVRVILVTGKNKNAAVKTVFEKPYDHFEIPGQVFRQFEYREGTTLWLIDHEAAEGVDLKEVKEIR